MDFKINEVYVAKVNEDVRYFKILDQVNDNQFLIQWQIDDEAVGDKEVLKKSDMIKWIQDYKVSIY